MDKLVFSCFLLGGLTPDPGPTDSCALNAYCSRRRANVGCNPPSITGGSACVGKSPQVIELLEADQTYILTYINGNRQSFASGELGNEPANRMFKLQWDANLATQAGHNARSCVVARDACRNTADYANVGQVIASAHGTTAHVTALPWGNPGVTLGDKIDAAISNSIDFYPYFAGTALSSGYTAATNTENAANILNDRATKVGCAVMQWTEGDELYIYLVCNFSANVLAGQLIFRTGFTAGLGCATKDTTYPALCLT